MGFHHPDLKAADQRLKWSATRGTQTVQMAMATLAEMDRYEGEILSDDDLPQPWSVTLLPTNRILLTANNGKQLVCYLADPVADARLILDDYIPEIGLDAQ
jgi:hypothetical protein